MELVALYGSRASPSDYPGRTSDRAVTLLRADRQRLGNIASGKAEVHYALVAGELSVVAVKQLSIFPDSCFDKATDCLCIVEVYAAGLETRAAYRASYGERAKAAASLIDNPAVRTENYIRQYW
jgi:hypothetical protein